MRLYLRTSALVLPALLAGLAITQPQAAHAQLTSQTVTFKYIGANAANNISITSNGSSFTTVTAGRYTGTVNNSTGFNIFCTDLTHTITVADAPLSTLIRNVTDAPAGTMGSDGFYNSGMESAMNSKDYKPTTTGYAVSSRDNAVAWLAQTYLDATSATFTNGYSLSQNMTAIQLAIWDIVQDGGDGLGLGNTRLNNGTGYTADFNLYSSLANTYITSAKTKSSFTSTNVAWLQTQRGNLSGTSYTHVQDFVALRSSNNVLNPVPEPGAYVTGLVMAGTTGLGLVRGRLRSRRKAA